MRASTLILFLAGAACGFGQYTPDWSSLDTRPIPLWYDEAKLGIFMHWGVYSVPGYISEWFWYYWRTQDKSAVSYMQSNYAPTFQYPQFAPDFSARFFNANDFAKLIQQSGAKYFVPTSKHHEGYTMYRSNYSWNWNSVDVGPGRDIMGELVTALNTVAPDLKFGLYYSLYEWFHPLYLKDKAANFTSQDYVQQVSYPQLQEVVNAYHPHVIFSDGDWEATSDYWKAKDFLAWLYNESPVKDTIVVNDRWGTDANCAHGDTRTCGDKFNPGVLQKHKWVNCMTIDRNSWGYRRNLQYSEVLSIQELIGTLAITVSCGGNLLMNFGPTSDGTIPPIFQERLIQMGQWLKINGDGIYATKAWIYQNDTINGNVWYTSTMRDASQLDPRRMSNPQIQDNTIVYAIVLKWPDQGQLELGSPRVTDATTVTMLGYTGGLKFKPKSSQKGIKIDLTSIPFAAIPNNWAWVIKMEYLGSDQRNPLAPHWGHNIV